MWFLILGFVVGTILGSFTKVLADRSLIKSSIRGRSYCPHCKVSLQWYDLLPIVSFILLRGKCRYCRKAISIDYLLVEVVMGLLIGLLFWQSLGNFQSFDSLRSLRTNFLLPQAGYSFSILVLELLFKVFSICILMALFLTDLKKMLIPDRIVLPAILISLIYMVVITVIKIGYLYYFLIQTPIGRRLLPPYSDYFQRHVLITAEPLFGAILTSVTLALFFIALIIITRGKGMGGGDVYLGAFIGIMLGFPGAILAVVLAFLSGALVSLGLIFTGKKHFGQVIPFGPFLVLGALTTLFWGNQIMNWYMHFSFKLGILDKRLYLFR